MNIEARPRSSHVHRQLLETSAINRVMFCALGLILIICAVRPVVSVDASFEKDLNPTKNSASSISGNLKPAKKPTDSIDGDLNLKKKKEKPPPPSWVGTSAEISCQERCGIISVSFRESIPICIPWILDKEKNEFNCELNDSKLKPFFEKYQLQYREFKEKMAIPDDRGNYGTFGRKWLEEKGWKVMNPPYTAKQIEKAAKKDLKPLDKQLKELKKAREKEKQQQCTGDACPLPPPGKKSRFPWKSSDVSMSSSSSGSKGWFSSRRHGSSSTMSSSGASMNKADSSKKTESSSGSSRGWFSRRRPSAEGDLSTSEPGTFRASMTSIKESESDSDSGSTTSSEPPETPPPEKLNKTPSMASEAGTSTKGSLKKIESTGGGTFSPKECIDYCNTVEGYIVINPGYSRIPITKGFLADNGEACDCKLRLVDIRDYLVKVNLNATEFFDTHAAGSPLGRRWLTDHGITVDFRKTLDERFKEQNEEDARAGGTSEITPA